MIRFDRYWAEWRIFSRQRIRVAIPNSSFAPSGLEILQRHGEHPRFDALHERADRRRLHGPTRETSQLHKRGFGSLSMAGLLRSIASWPLRPFRSPPLSRRRIGRADHERRYHDVSVVMMPVRMRRTGRKLLYNPYFH